MKRAKEERKSGGEKPAGSGEGKEGIQRKTADSEKSGTKQEGPKDTHQLSFNLKV